MKTEVREAGPFERTLTVEIEEAELEEAKTRAARKLSESMKIKGFRPGKAPRAVVERMVGADTLRSEAIEEALPSVVGEALVEADLRPVTTPRVEDIRDRDGGGVEVDVKVTLWPQVDEVPDLSSYSIIVDRPEVDDDEVEAHLDRLRSQFADLEDVEREADEGDFVMINITTLVDGEELEEASATDLLYEVGSRSFIPGLDDLLVGATAGTIKEGPGILPQGFGDHSGEEVTLRVLVKGVRAKKLPEVTDEWVSDISEFETVEELREQVREGLLDMKIHQIGDQFQEQLMERLVADLDVELPEDLTEAEMEATLRNMMSSLQQQGIDLGTYLQITGQDQESFVADLRGRAERALKTRVLLEAVAATHDLEVEDDEYEAALASIAEGSETDVETVRKALEEGGQRESLTGDILRRKALDYVLGEAQAIDADGEPVDLSHALGKDGGHGEPAGAEGATEEEEPDRTEHEVSADTADSQGTTGE